MPAYSFIFGRTLLWAQWGGWFGIDNLNCQSFPIKLLYLKNSNSIKADTIKRKLGDKWSGTILFPS